MSLTSLQDYISKWRVCKEHTCQIEQYLKGFFIFLSKLWKIFGTDSRRNEAWCITWHALVFAALIYCFLSVVAFFSWYPASHGLSKYFLRKVSSVLLVYSAYLVKIERDCCCATVYICKIADMCMVPQLGKDLNIWIYTKICSMQNLTCRTSNRFINGLCKLNELSWFR